MNFQHRTSNVQLPIIRIQNTEYRSQEFRIRNLSRLRGYEFEGGNCYGLRVAGGCGWRCEHEKHHEKRVCAGRVYSFL